MICDCGAGADRKGVWLILELCFHIIHWLIGPLDCKQQKPALVNVSKKRTHCRYVK